MSHQMRTAARTRIMASCQTASAECGANDVTGQCRRCACGRTGTLLPLALLLCSTFLGSSAGAQTLATPSSSSTSGNTDDTLAEIIVTARKKTESVQSIPESITVIDANTISRAHLTTLDDFNSLVTNLNITQRADNTPDVVLRGVGAFGIVQGVGFYVNDIQQFDGQSVRPDDIERIEVLKGPQGTIFGGSNVGGAIKYVTKLPSDTLTGEATLEYGEFHDRIVDAVVSGPILPGELLARLSLFNEETDGYLFDPTLKQTLPQSKETGGRLTLEFPGDQTKILFYLSGDHINSQNMNLYYTPPDDHTYQNVYRGGVDGSVPLYKRDLYAPTLEITHDFGDVVLSSNSSYFHSSITTLGNLDKGATPPRFANYIQDFRKSVVSQEFRLASSGASSLKWLVGAFAQEIQTDSLQLQDFGSVAVVGSPVGERPNPFATSSIQNRHFNHDYALFGNASYALDDWTVEGGLRIAHFINTLTDTPYFNTFAQTGSSCGPCSGRVSETDVLPKVSVDYHFTKDVMGYVTIARGDEEADFTENTDAAGVNEVLPYKTEFALSYEAGVKTTLFDRHLTLNIAGFYIDYKNRLFEITQFTPSGYFTYTDNIGSSKNYGFELEAVVRPTSEFSLTAGVGVTRAIFGNAIFKDGYGNPVNANGNQAAYTPEYQATLAIDWRHPLSDELVLDSSVNTRFVGRSYWDSAGCSGNVTLAAVTALNTPPYNVPPANIPTPPYLACPSDGFRYEQRPYQIVNAGVSLDIGKHWRTGAHVENVFDTRYNTWFSAASESGAPYNIAQLNRPRQWFLSVTARY
jgi:iron complex outermembrane recepter protein